MSAKHDIITKFGPTAENDEIIAKCESILKIFSINVEELFVRWETFNFQKGENLQLSLSNLESLILYIQSSLEKKKQPQSNKVHQKMKIRPLSSSPNNMFSYSPTTPVSKRIKLETPLKNSMLHSSPDAKSIAQINVTETPPSTLKQEDVTPSKPSNTVIETLNPQIANSQGYTNILADSTTTLKPLKITANFDASKYKFRTMRQKLLEAADVLDDQIDTVAKTIQQEYNLAMSEFGNACVASQFEIVAVGRIVPDSPSNSGVGLNSSSLFLEMSRLGGIGHRTRIDLSNVTSGYSLFPGQIVAFRGVNPTGEKFVVKEVLKLPLLGASVTNENELNDYKEILDGNSLKYVVVSGPYTSHSDLNYDHLENLISRFNEIQPHGVIFCGPFIDITHPQIVLGSVSIPELSTNQQPKTLDEFFKKKLTPIFKKINTKIQVVLIPHTNDTASKHCSYPQDSFDKKLLSLPKNFKCFPNPSMFQFNEVSIGVSTADVFKDLRDINSSDMQLMNRFERVAGHVLEQRRFYPVFPGGYKVSSSSTTAGDINLAEGSQVTGASLEVPYLGLTEFNGILPDMLILPSELNHFAKVIRDVIVINPGSLVKSGRGGTYAVVSVEGLSEHDAIKNEEDGLLFNGVYKRCRVDIIKV